MEVATGSQPAGQFVRSIANLLCAEVFVPCRSALLRVRFQLLPQPVSQSLEFRRALSLLAPLTTRKEELGHLGETRVQASTFASATGFGRGEPIWKTATVGLDPE